MTYGGLKRFYFRVTIFSVDTMKKILYVVVLLLTVISANSSYAQLNIWRSQNPPTVSGTLNAVQIITPSRIYAVGDQASFLTSVDSGNSWKAYSSIVPINYFNCYGLSFIDSITGMVVGKSGAIKTTNAGKTWAIMTTPLVTAFYGVLMLDSNIGFIVGASNTILKTTNAGITWTNYNAELQVGTLKSIRKVRSDFLVITGDNGYIFVSSDTGKHWSQVYTDHGNQINSVAFTSDSVAIAVGENGYITKTIDQGANWKTQTLVDTIISVTASLNAIASKDPQRFIVVGNNANVIYSEDAGSTWKKPYLELGGVNIHLRGLDLLTPMYGIAVGEQGFIMRTTDGGATWKFLPNSPFYNILRSIAFPKGDTSNGIAVGNFGAVLITSNGGKKWSSIAPFTYLSLRSVIFSDSVTAFAVGDDGIMFRTSDRGSHWAKQAIPTKATLRSITFPTSQVGFAAGDSATVLETSTGGLSWHRLKIPYPDNEGVSGISFCDAKNGMIVTANELEFTTDGGLSWKSQPGVGYGCFMISPTHYSVASLDTGPLIMHGMVTTTFNGKTTVVLGYNAAFFSVVFCDEYRGVVVGMGGQIYHTTDGGMTWEQHASNTDGIIYGIAYPSVAASSVCGIRGTILRRTSDEAPLADVQEQPSASRNSGMEIVAAFPNPATRYTEISFSLARPMPLSIAIYDIRGAKMRSADLGIVASGEHSEMLSLDGLASGAYILELRSPTEVNTISLRIDK